MIPRRQFFQSLWLSLAVLALFGCTDERRDMASEEALQELETLYFKMREESAQQLKKSISYYNMTDRAKAQPFPENWCDLLRFRIDIKGTDQIARLEDDPVINRIGSVTEFLVDQEKIRTAFDECLRIVTRSPNKK